MKMLFSLLFAALIKISFNQEISWDFRNFQQWTEFSTTCSPGQVQSPINLQCNLYTARHPLNRSYEYMVLGFINYNNDDEKSQQLEIINTGYTVQLSGSWGKNVPSIKGLICSHQVCTLSNVHLHWGTDDNNGTEHAIDGQKYASELHLVHSSQKYNTPYVVAILYEVNDNAVPNPGMCQLAQLTQNVLCVNNTACVRSFDLSSFIPKPLPPMYIYRGSLTTPPWTENVYWIILSEPQPITSKIIRLFRNVVLSHGATHNIRPLQPINKRLIEFYTY